MSSPEEIDSRLREAARLMMQDLPDEFGQLCDRLRVARRIFHEELGRALASPLTEEAGKRPQDELHEKRTLASWLNDLVRSLGLAIECPKTGKPSTLIADWRDGEQDASRYRLQIIDDRGRQTRSYTSRSLPVLKLCEDRSRYQRHQLGTYQSPGGDRSR